MIHAVFALLNSGLTIAKKDITGEIEKEMLVSNLMAALESFSQEIFQGKELEKIEVGNRSVALAGKHEPLDLIVAVVSNEDDPAARVLASQLVEALSSTLSSFSILEEEDMVNSGVQKCGIEIIEEHLDRMQKGLEKLSHEAQAIINQEERVTEKDLSNALDVSPIDLAPILPALKKVESPRTPEIYYAKEFFEEKQREVKEKIRRMGLTTFGLLRREVGLSDEILQDVLASLDLLSFGRESPLYCSEEYWEKKRQTIETAFKEEKEREDLINRIAAILGLSGKYAGKLIRGGTLAEFGANVAKKAKEAGKIEDALQILKNVLQITPQFAEGWLELGKIKYDQGKFSSAIKLFKNALKHDKGLINTLQSFGRENPRYIVSACRGGKIIFWDAGTLKKVLTLQNEGAIIWSFTLTPGGRYLATGRNDGTISIWDIGEKKKMTKLQGHEKAIKAVAFSNEGKKLVSASDDTQVILWDSKTGKIIQKFSGHTKPVTSVRYSAKDQLASVSKEGKIIFWDEATGKEKKTFSTPQESVTTFCFDPRGERLAAGFKHGDLLIWDLTKGEKRAWKGHNGKVTAIEFTPDGEQLISASEEPLIIRWDLKTDSGMKLRQVEKVISSLDISQNGKYLLAGTWGNRIHVWDLESEKHQGSIKELKSWVEDVAWYLQ